MKIKPKLTASLTYRYGRGRGWTFPRWYLPIASWMHRRQLAAAISDAKAVVHRADDFAHAEHLRRCFPRRDIDVERSERGTWRVTVVMSPQEGLSSRWRKTLDAAVAEMVARSASVAGKAGRG